MIPTIWIAGKGKYIETLKQSGFQGFNGREEGKNEKFVQRAVKLYEIVMVATLAYAFFKTCTTVQ